MKRISALLDPCSKYNLENRAICILTRTIAYALEFPGCCMKLLAFAALKTNTVSTKAAVVPSQKGGKLPVATLAGCALNHRYSIFL